MKKLRSKLLGFLTAAYLALYSCVGNAGGSPMRDGDILQGYHAAAWQMACEAKRVDCTTIRPPIVAYSLMPGGTWGMYPHFHRVVLINLRLITHPEQVPVITHEMVHYIQNEQGYMVLGGENFRSRCAREKEAFDLTYEMTQKYGLDPRGVIVFPWAAMAMQYGCPVA